MKELKIGVLKEGDLESIKPLIGKYDFSDYRYYRVFKKEALDGYVYGQIFELVNKGGWVVVAKKGRSLEGLISLGRLSWARDVFGMKMAEFKHLITYGTYGYRRKIMSELLSCVLNLCISKGIKHLSCRVNTVDYAVIHCLEEAGFKIMETQVTYLFNKRKHKIPGLRDLYRARTFKEKDLEYLVDMIKGSFVTSRFCVDPSISSERKDRFYIKWVNDCASGLLADRIIVAEKKNSIVGFLTYRINRELEKISGVKIGGQGLSAILPKSKGVYVSLIRESMRDAALMADFAEYDTQLNNFEVIKIWQRLGLDFVRSKYTFHKYLGRHLKGL